MDLSCFIVRQAKVGDVSDDEVLLIDLVVGDSIVRRAVRFKAQAKVADEPDERVLLIDLVVGDMWIVRRSFRSRRQRRR